MKAQNLIIEGDCFIGLEKVSEKEVLGLKRNIDKYFSNLSYVNETRAVPFLLPDEYHDKFLSMTFIHNVSFPKLTKFQNIKLDYGFLKRDELFHSEYFKKLKSTRVDWPWEINVLLSLSKYEDKPGIMITIRTKPVLFFRLNQKAAKISEKPIDEFEYTSIIETNKEFIIQFMKALNTSVVKSPDVLVDYTKEQFESSISYLLKEYEFEKVDTILNEGFTKLKQGKVKDSLDELRSAVEIFIYEVTKRKCDKVEVQSKIKSNLSYLKDNHLIDEKIFGFFQSTIISLWSTSSDRVSHKREHFNISEGVLLFDTTKTCFEYLIKKCIE
ncbi:hypothetical protein HQ533_04130 [Candidatus Woesearchaeota archaeon]|nr:hypothetical protein [Candidatus Woesearchaeota archaeon]